MKNNNALIVLVAIAGLLFFSFSACQNSASTSADNTSSSSPTPAVVDKEQIEFVAGDSLIRIASLSSAKTNDLIKYIDRLSQSIFDAAGGPMTEDPARPKLYQDTTLSTKILIEQGKGYELMKKVQSTRTELLELLDDPQELVATLPLKTDIESESEKDWVKANFQDVPVALIFPKLKKIKSEARRADQMIREHLQ